MEGDFSYANNPVTVTLSSNENATITLTITNDDMFELTERFSANLSFPNQGTLPPGVTLNQTSADVYILDNDGESSVLVCCFLITSPVVIYFFAVIRLL